MLVDNFWVGNTQYTIHCKNGTCELHEIEEVNYDEYEVKVVTTGTYEHCRKIVEKTRVAYLESLF